jgi:hypothetical protein
MGNPAPVRGSLSDARATMMIMCILVEELLCHGVTRWILVLKYLLSGARRRLWPRLVMLSIKCRRFLRVQFLWCLPGTKKTTGVTTGGLGMYRDGSRR